MGARSQDLSALGAGNYSVTVTDGNGCTAPLSVTITEAALLVLTETHVNVLCNGQSTGSIDLTVSGGLTPYTYAWSTGATSQDLSALGAGNYSVTVTDGNGCTAPLIVTITEAAEMFSPATHVTVLCNGQSTGSIDLTVSGGVTPYTYAWSTGATSQGLSALGAGNYSVTGTDGNGGRAGERRGGEEGRFRGLAET